MNQPERPRGEWGATRPGRPARAPGGPSEQRAERERVERQSERDRILGRVRTTTAVTGIGAVLAGGALAGWLGHTATDSSTSTSDSSSTGSADSSTSDGTDGTDGGLTSPDTVPDSGGSADQPGITSGGS
jgi:hypothetical protein